MKKAQTGDIFTIKLSENAYVVGIVLFKSKVFRNASIVGIYNHLFESINKINVNELHGYEFYLTPNYTTSYISKAWDIIAHSDELASQVDIPALRAAGDLFKCDEIVGKVAVRDFPKYTELSVAGVKFLENKLKKHFQL